MKKTISLFLILVMTFSLVACKSTIKNDLNIQNEVIEEIDLDNSLIVGVIEYPPFITYENNELSGPYIDILTSTLNYYNLDYEFKIFPWTRLMESLKDGSVDMAIPFFDTPERRLYMHYLEEPIGLSQYNIIVPSDSEITFDGDLFFLSVYDIGIVKDYFYTTELTNAIDNGIIKVDEAFSSQNNILKLIQGRVDLIIENFAIVNEYIKDSNKSDQLKVLDHPLTYNYAYIVFSKKHDYSKIMKELNSHLQYIKKNGSFYNFFENYDLKYYSDAFKAMEINDPPPPRFVQTEDNSPLKVGILGNTKPYAYYENNKLTGFTVDLISEVLDRVGVKYELIDLPFSRMLELLKNGSLDIGTDIYLTEERQNFFEYPDLPFAGYPTVIFKRSNMEFNFKGDLNELAPYNLSYVRDYNLGPLEKYKNSKEYNLLEADSPEKNIENLINNRVDLIIDIKSTGESFIDNMDLENRIEPMNPPLFYDYSYIVFSKANNLTSLTIEYEIAIDSMFEDGTIKTLSEKYDIPYLEFESFK